MFNWDENVLMDMLLVEDVQLYMSVWWIFGLVISPVSYQWESFQWLDTWFKVKSTGSTTSHTNSDKITNSLYLELQAFAKN